MDCGGRATRRRRSQFTVHPFLPAAFSLVAIADVMDKSSKKLDTNILQTSIAPDYAPEPRQFINSILS